jgi:anti-sigma-K factor RskA
VVAHRIDDLAARAAKNNGLVAKRAALAALVPQLRDAQRAHDAKKFDALRKAMIDRWNALADEYRALAPSPELRARFDVELNQALDTMGHMHM